MHQLALPLLSIIAMIFTFGCAVPQYLWPQDDVAFSEINSDTLAKKILIASRKSDFKSEVVETIQTAFQGQDVYIKTIGIDALNQEDANRYSAVLIINTSMAWRIDRKVASFLHQYGQLDSIIVLTTSAGGEVLPDMDNNRVDAISAASTKASLDQTAREIIAKVDNLLYH